jgi:Calcineurin-like phosphoesterase superfamily domain
MRVPVIADVRGDLDALRSVLAAIDRCEADQIWCLGDIVGLGATTPVEVVDLVRERCASALAGNHDRRGTGQLTPDMLPLPRQRAQLQGQRRALSNDQLAWLGSPPQPLNPASRTRLVDTENSTACGPPPGASAARRGAVPAVAPERDWRRARATHSGPVGAGSWRALGRLFCLSTRASAAPAPAESFALVPLREPAKLVVDFRFHTSASTDHASTGNGASPSSAQSGYVGALV